MMAALLYIGAGAGMLCFGLARKIFSRDKTRLRLTKKEAPYAVSMIALDIAAPILLMLGLKTTAAQNVSLLNNFEIVATSCAALFFFKETIGKRLWLAIGLITLASLLLSFQDAESFSFSPGSIFVLLACVCWGFENNCTRRMSAKDPVQIVVLKGLFSGLGSLIVAFAAGEKLPRGSFTALVLLLGFVAYGLSIFFYVLAQRGIGAAKTSAYYAIAPFIGVLLSLLIFRERPDSIFAAALLIMIAGTYLISSKSRGKKIQAAAQ